MDTINSDQILNSPAGNKLPAEPVIRLIYTSRLVSVGIFRCRPWHDLFHEDGRARAHMMVFPRSSVYIQHEHSPTLVATPNMIMFYNQGQEYQRRKLSERGDNCEFFSFDERIIRQVAGNISLSWKERDRPFPMTHGSCDAQVYLQQRRVVDHILHSPLPDEVYIQETMMQVLEQALAHAGRGVMDWSGNRHDSTKQVHRKLAQDAQAILAASYHEPPSLETLAAMLYTSPYHLCRVFRRETGQTINHYLNQLRLHTSLEWVTGEKEDLSRVAMNLGYSSHSHFTQAFKRLFGLPPSRIGVSNSRPVTFS